MEPVYPERKILTGTAIGGPIAAGYFLWKNYSAFGHRKCGQYAFAACVLYLIALLGGGLIFPALNRPPTLLFSAVFLFFMAVIVRTFLRRKIRDYLHAGGSVFGWGNTIFVALIAAILTMAQIFALAYVAPQALDPYTSKEYGRLKHNVTFNPANIPELEVDVIAAAFTRSGFFDDEKRKDIDVNKKEETYVISIYCNETIKTEPDASAPFHELHSDIRLMLQPKKIVFDLVIDTPDNVFKRIE